KMKLLDKEKLHVTANQ
ncbi:hypothetical protein E2320_008729, partial [Naja naja]